MICLCVSVCVCVCISFITLPCDTYTLLYTSECEFNERKSGNHSKYPTTTEQH